MALNSDGVCVRCRVIKAMMAGGPAVQGIMEQGDKATHWDVTYCPNKVDLLIGV